MLHVVVVGGGPAGLTAAETLARAGLKTTLVECRPERVLPCAGLVTHRFLQDFAIPEHLLDQRVDELAVFSPTNRVAFATLTAPERYAGVMRRELLQSVLKRRAEEAGVSFIHGRFKRFRHGEGDYPQLEIQIEGARSPELLSCDVVVGADGVHSRVARAIGLPALELGVVYQERLNVPAGRLAAPGAMQLHFGRKVSADYYGWLLPHGDHLQLGVTTRARYGKRVWDMLGELKRRLGSHLDGAKGAGREAFCYPLAHRDQLVHDRVLLVGDAAGLVAPATRDGLYYACQSGRLAAEAIVQHQHVPVEERLADYQRAFFAAYGPVFKGLKRLEKTFFRSDRRREALIDLAWDRDVQRAAADAFLEKRRFAPALPVRLKLQARLVSQLVKYSMVQPKRHDPDVASRMPEPENYLDRVLKSPTGPLTLPPDMAPRRPEGVPPFVPSEK